MVGKLFVAATLEQVYQRLIEKSVLILVSQTIKTLVVSLCILVIIYYLVIRHINRIVSYAQKLSLDRLAVELTLEGRPRPASIRTSSMRWPPPSTRCVPA